MTNVMELPTDVIRSVRTMSNRTTGLCLFVILTIAGVLRLWDIGNRPGYEWDETVYAAIGKNVANGQGVILKPELGVDNVTYLSHPPFYFWLLGGWFKVFGEGITQARVLGALCSLVMIALVFLLVNEIASRHMALVAAAVVAIDGWMVFTGRVSWIENSQMILIVGGMFAYARASRLESSRWFIGAGLLLGFATAYKHLGAYVLVAVGIHWAITRRQSKRHLMLFGAAAAVIVAYFVGMGLAFGDRFWRASGNQLARTFGFAEARGTINSTGDVVKPLIGQYSIFVGTVLLAAVAFVVICVRIVQCVRLRSFMPVEGNSLLFAWSVAAVVCFGAISLKMPHYFELLFVPMSCYLVVEVAGWSRYGTAKWRQKAIAGCAVVMIALSVLAVWGRIVVHHNNALEQAIDYVSTSVPHDSVVVADQTIGTAIPQPFCDLDRRTNCGTMPEYVVVYLSHTQQLPDDPVLQTVIERYLDKEAVFTGFKESITIYRVKSTP